LKHKYLILILIVLCFGIGSCRRTHRAIADYSGDVEEIWTVQGDAQKRLSDYHWFEEKYQSIQAERTNLKLRSSRDDVIDEIMIVNRWIADYNAKSREYDRAMWKRNDLPYSIEQISSVDDL
jgi:hypothetical protein